MSDIATIEMNAMNMTMMLALMFALPLPARSPNDSSKSVLVNETLYEVFQHREGQYQDAEWKCFVQSGKDQRLAVKPIAQVKDFTIRTTLPQHQRLDQGVSI